MPAGRELVHGPGLRRLIPRSTSVGLGGGEAEARGTARGAVSRETLPDQKLRMVESAYFSIEVKRPMMIQGVVSAAS